MNPFALLADVILWVVYALVMAALAAVLFSWCRSLRMRGGAKGSNGVPQTGIKVVAILLPLVCGVITFAMASSTPIVANGITYDNVMWLLLSDMLIYTILAMLTVAVLAVLFGMSGISRRITKRWK